MRDPRSYFEDNAVAQKDLSASPWVILSPERHAIKKQVEAQGIPLEKWDIQIYRGVLTGFNDAFYLTQEQRDTFIAQDPNCAKYLVPLLRGRYVSRYATDWDGTWMIATFPILKLKFEDLPQPIQKHLKSFQSRLEPKPKDWKGSKWNGRKAGAYRWFETQDVIGYHREFDKPKIIYPEITKYLPFYYDKDDGIFGNQKCFILTSSNQDLAYLAAFLNSALFKYCFSDNFPELMGNTYEVRKIFVDIIPVKKPSTAEAEFFAKLVPLVQAAKKAKLNTEASFLETLIDACVMECYFREHMAERDLLFQDTVDQLHDYQPSQETATAEAINALVDALQATDLPQKLAAIPGKSPDLLGVMMKEGKV